MITFACKKIRQDELIRCSFNLNKTEYNLLMFLLGKKEFYTATQIAKSMGLERTTIQKAVKKLVAKNLTKRRQRNLSKGGYVFMYEVNNKEEIKKEMKRIVYEWYKSVEVAINRL